MTDIDIYKKITLLPDDLKKEADNFIEFLLSKKEKKQSKRKPGLAKGLVKMSDDFDEPLDDFDEYMPE